MTVVGGLAAQLVERAFCHKSAVGDDTDAVGHAFGDFENVRGHDDGAAGAGALAQHAFDLPRRAGVEAGERLVENDQRAARAPSAPASATFWRMPLEKLSQRSSAFAASPSQANSSCARVSASAGGEIPQPGDEFEVLPRRQLVVDHRLIGDPRGQPFRRLSDRRARQSRRRGCCRRRAAASPAIMRRVVVLPAPFGPSSA